MVDQAEDLKRMMAEDTKQNSQGGKKTRIITISSGKGGVGKTNIAVNMGIAYAQLGKKVIVMDADLGLANVNVCLGIIPKYNLYQLIKKQKTMKEIIIDTNFGIQIVAGASGFSKIANLTEKERHDFIKELDVLGYADILIIDTGAGVSQNVLDFVIAADEAIIITTPEPTAITDAYGIIKIIATEINNPKLELKLIVNRVNSVVDGRKVAERVINIAGQFLNIKVDNLGMIYEDPIVSQGVIRQTPFIHLDPKSKASISLKHIVSRLEGIDYKDGGGIKNFVGKLIGLK
ncbi:MAG: ATP-binding protein [Spirochaetes bacterium GWF1_31_7]|nr:MAG: ATP-binding protein [Spirochaetes bacterium GWE1_32_154]OHD45265.1 MAG: ATP-binding protein [Spirochaetes bacterium GWE2_31_10]OHD50560.1 MAG: ATP-binding protein [Spirochaetes bacterium GWF1_31_7]OHD79008.1 MAG: ATP-binding protein [Spirochaetes bacterium RIFOXYB1_FULL_32_8]HBD94586.1 ATP-binding protein [Spirochaetia bacterium]